MAAAQLDFSGNLIEANAGFLRLLAESALLPGDTGAIGAGVAPFLIQPAFAALLAAPVAGDHGEGLVHSGLLTLGNRQGKTRTLRGRVWKTPDGLRVLAEHDIEELERVNQAFMDLSHEAAESQMEVGRANLRLRLRESQIVEQSLTDPLTGAGNRARLKQALAVEITRAHRAVAPLSAFMADLDFFKRVNDRYGHAAGDSVLVRFVGLMREQIRATDVLARYGGEEFVVLMPDTGLADGIRTAERIRAAFGREIIPPLPEPVTASFGVAELRGDESGESLIDRADMALYAAKQGGRNRVVAAGDV